MLTKWLAEVRRVAEETEDALKPNVLMMVGRKAEIDARAQLAPK